ncbi:hypothetical protein ACH5RR_000916, partial [Cinchona calisaya]
DSSSLEKDLVEQSKEDTRDIDSLDITAGPTESQSKDELDLGIEKFTEELLAYFSKLDCPNSSNEPRTMQEWKMVSRLLAQKLKYMDSLPFKQEDGFKRHCWKTTCQPYDCNGVDILSGEKFSKGFSMKLWSKFRQGKSHSLAARYLKDDPYLILLNVLVSLQQSG